MEVTKVMHVNGGDGITSYANNSLLQRKAISKTQPILEAAITALYSSILTGMTTPKLVIADLGCSSGPNTLFAVREIIKLVKELIKKKNKQISQPEYQIFLNDLPANDFNTIFRSLPESDDQILGDDCFFSGVPGSFYTRLFPRNTLHFVHSSNSLHWLSQVPKGVEANKGNIYIVSTTPASVLEAYYKQFKHDFSKFLKCRAQEVVPNGRMVLTLAGRNFEDPATASGLCLLWELLAMAINEMVTEGVIEEEKMYGFNLPLYNPSEAEVKEEVLKQGSFFIESLEFSEVNWSGYDDNDYANGGYSTTEEALVVARSIRSVTESLIIDYFGEAVVEDVFHRYYLLIADHLSKEKPKIVCLIVSLVRTFE